MFEQQTNCTSQRSLERFRDFFLGYIYLHSRDCKPKDLPLLSPKQICLHYRAKVSRSYSSPLPPSLSLPHPTREGRKSSSCVSCPTSTPKIHDLKVSLIMSPHRGLGHGELTQLRVIKRLDLIQNPSVICQNE